MKTNKFSILVLGCFAIAPAFTVNAQDNQTLLLYQDSVQLKLERFGLRMLSYPSGEYMQCNPVGQPMFKTPALILPTQEGADPVQVYGDTTGFAKTDKLRNVFWIHGLNGNSNSLSMAAQASQYGVPGFQSRKIRSFWGLSSSNSTPVQMYSEDAGIAATAGQLNSYAYQHLFPPDRTTSDFIVAHSQGGIVGREWLRQMDLKPTVYDKYAYGIVTFGTPHAGAEVLNNCRPNLGRDRVPAFMNEACQSLGGALVIPKMNSNFFTSLIPSKYINDMIGASCEVLSKSIIPIVMDNYYKATTKDFYVGAPFLTGSTINGTTVQGLNQYTSKVPVVQFYGVEEQPIMWRFMSSTMDIGEVQKNALNTEIPFGYTYDYQLPNKVNNVINDFNANYIFEQNKERNNNIKAGIDLVHHFLYKRRAKLAKENKEAYGRAIIWLTNANDYYLTDLIGAREVSSSVLKCISVGLVSCRSPIYNPISSNQPPTLIFINSTTYPPGNTCLDYVGKPLDLKGHKYSSKWNPNTVGDCLGKIDYIFSSWIIAYSYKENDGVVLAESAKYPISVDPKQSHMYEKMNNTNHDQMKNCRETQRALLDLYDGRLGRFFETDPTF